MTFLLRVDNYPQERRSEPKALTHSNPIYVSVNKAGIINRSAPAERVAAVTESCPSHQTPGGCSAGAVAPRCPRRAKKSERGALFSSKNAPMSPERSSGQVWREATSGVWGRAPSARKRIYHRLGNIQQTARLRTRARDSAPRPRWPLRARPGQGFTLNPRTRFGRLRFRFIGALPLKLRAGLAPPRDPAVASATRSPYAGSFNGLLSASQPVFTAKTMYIK